MVGPSPQYLPSLFFLADPPYATLAGLSSVIKHASYLASGGPDPPKGTFAGRRSLGAVFSRPSTAAYRIERNVT